MSHGGSTGRTKAVLSCRCARANGGANIFVHLNRHTAIKCTLAHALISCNLWHCVPFMHLEEQNPERRDRVTKRSFRNARPPSRRAGSQYDLIRYTTVTRYCTKYSMLALWPSLDPLSFASEVLVIFGFGRPLIVSYKRTCMYKSRPMFSLQCDETSDRKSVV